MNQQATQQQANQVEVKWYDERQRDGRLNLNGKSTRLFLYPTGRLLKDARQQYWWTVEVANEWNVSNPLRIQAGSVEVLVKKLEAHEYRLVPYSARNGR